MRKATVRAKLVELEIPTSMINFMKGTGDIAIVSPYFKLPGLKQIADSSYLQEKTPQNKSKMILGISPPTIAYKLADANFTDNFTFIANDTYTYSNPFNESKASNKELSMRTSDELIEKLLQLENIISFTTEFLILSTFSNIPKSSYESATTDEDLIKILFSHLASLAVKASNKASPLDKMFKALSPRYYTCISSPQIWAAEEGKIFIKPTEDEMDENGNISKYCSLIEVVNNLLSPTAGFIFGDKQHPKFVTKWLKQKLRLIPTCRRISYIKNVDGNEEEREFVKNMMTFKIKFEDTPENVRKGLYRPLPEAIYTKRIKEEGKKVSAVPLDFNTYITFYNGKQDFVEGEQITARTSQCWEGPIVFEIKCNMMLFGKSYPKVSCVCKCFGCHKRDPIGVDTYADIIGQYEGNETDEYADVFNAEDE